MNNCTIIWAAYNEEFTLEKSIQSVKKALKYAQKKLNEKYGNKIQFHGIICHNGCTDNTPQIAKKVMKKSQKTNFKINVIESDKGLIKAQKACVEYLKKKKRNRQPLIFIDADILTNPNSIFLILEQFIKHPKLKAVGAHPLPLTYKGKNPYKIMTDKILNCRAYFPKSEIAINIAPEFHPYTESDPQPIGPEFEKRSKIYFHGRCFALRNADIWDVEEDSIGDDTFLDRSIHYRYGPGSIRTVYNAKVYFNPLLSLKDYYKAYTRVYLDLQQLRTKHPEFDKVREFSKTTLDKAYIKSLPLNARFNFFLYRLIKNAVYTMFKKNILFIPKDKIWNYNSKRKFIITN